jgi:Biopolymer transport protein ExbD/TolR
MAEVNTSAGSDRRKGFACSKKLSTRVDLTPMVDLGFLLITFFIFTYHMSTPKKMNLIMPADGTGITVGNSAALTVIPSSGNEIFFYHGDLMYALQTGLYGFTNYALSDGLGDIIRAKQKAMDQVKPGMRKDLMLIIKPTPGSSYENVINTLDEVMINDVPHYAIVDVSNAEISVMSDRRK